MGDVIRVDFKKERELEEAFLRSLENYGAPCGTPCTYGRYCQCTMCLKRDRRNGWIGFGLVILMILIGIGATIALM